MLFTTLAVAVVAYTVIAGFSSLAAFVLGAIVAPSDAGPRHLSAPRGLLRLVTIPEGESLVNDASALVAYRLPSLW